MPRAISRVSFESSLAFWRADTACRGEIVCEHPLLTISTQVGINVVHPDGKVIRRFACANLSLKSLSLRSHPRLSSAD